MMNVKEICHEKVFDANRQLTLQDEDSLKTCVCTFLAVLSRFDIILQNISEKVSVVLLETD